MAVVSLLILASCSSSKKTANYDDVYYSTQTEDVKEETTDLQTADPDYYTESENAVTDENLVDYEAGEYVSYEEEPYYSESEVIEGEDGATNVTNNYYSSGYDDYYDYSYSARISRFYSPYSGFGYYSPCYVGFHYDPWYNPYWYMPSFYFGMSWGWGGYGWGYPHYYPYYGYYPYNSYWYGYNHGYWNGYWDGYYGSNYYGYYGYNDYGTGGSYYGHRPSRSSTNNQSGGTGTNGGSSAGSRSAYAERNKPVLNGGVTRGTIGTNSDIGSRSGNVGTIKGGTPGQEVKKINTTPTGDRAKVVDGNTKTRTGQGGVTGAPVANQTRRKVADKPNNVSNTSKDAKPRYTYKKPASTTGNKSRYQPGESIKTGRTTQPTKQYQKPATYRSDNNSSGSKSGNTKNTQVYTKPKSNSNDRYSKPTRYNTQSRTKQPTRSTDKYSQPSRSNTKKYTQPSRSSNNYSKPSSSGSNRSNYSRPSSSGSRKSYTPSRSSSSNRSYSSPSRSSSSSSRSSGSRSSSGGSSRGGKR